MTASTPSAPSDISEAVPAALLGWYDCHARTLPWRAAPGAPAPDPYRVWLSEVMLQQTTVAAVKPYFEQFTARWPDIDALAAAPEADVMAAWAGLGYYSRARNLVRCAREVAALGGFPATEAELRKLPGLGAYTAAAVAAIAFDQRAVVVDANVERVVSRLFAIAEPLPGSRRKIGEFAGSITPQTRAGDFAQAMMDLGSGICTTREPKCLLCPLSSHCAGRASGNPSAFPVKSPKAVKPTRQGTAFWIERDDAVWLVTRQGSGMLGGMRSLPDDGWAAAGDGSGMPPMPGQWEAAGLVRHTFSHFALELSVQRLRSGAPGSAAHPMAGGEWWPIDQLADAGLPTLFAKAARLARL
ncbi:A/G-specific adenine glycosylase [Allopontixanthobacter sediminis]|uniref:Adenine DNA glycosylase n=1 Tax=Allopontixanthobacter sediminis TaxID=1689985 RepID=A0A845B1B0_9SPHN|nr:A/G-specific adenine glycosylase [Allopontixanthobacter sediminis]MXP43207.1 A/G-specific adenine glycosylase [Allopontixanthobacter sediminis]